MNHTWGELEFLVDVDQGWTFLVNVVKHTSGGLGILCRCQSWLGIFVDADQGYTFLVNVVNHTWGGLGILCGGFQPYMGRDWVTAMNIKLNYNIWAIAHVV